MYIIKRQRLLFSSQKVKGLIKCFIQLYQPVSLLFPALWHSLIRSINIFKLIINYFHSSITYYYHISLAFYNISLANKKIMWLIKRLHFLIFHRNKAVLQQICLLPNSILTFQLIQDFSLPILFPSLLMLEIAYLLSRSNN